MKLTRPKFVLAASLLAAGCVDPTDFETTSVQVRTPQGIVTCQLYTRERVLWDRAIHRPEAMTVTEADQACVAEGRRQAGQ